MCASPCPEGWSRCVRSSPHPIFEFVPPAYVRAVTLPERQGWCISAPRVLGRPARKAASDLSCERAPGAQNLDPGSPHHAGPPSDGRPERTDPDGQAREPLLRIVTAAGGAAEISADSALTARDRCIRSAAGCHPVLVTMDPHARLGQVLGAFASLGGGVIRADFAAWQRPGRRAAQRGG
jgi:hypothetical protein